jgi:Tfp pilus assembly protein PilP
MTKEPRIDGRRAEASARVIGRTAGIALGVSIVVAALATLEVPAARAEQHVEPAERRSSPAASPAGFAYEPGGRRDPFISLERSSAPDSSARPRAAGLAGLLINEATLKGVVRSQGKLVAIVQAPDNRTYIVRPNDRLLDGAVRAVTPEAVVFVQQVDDPLALVKQQEVRKRLRPMEER